MMAVSSVHYDAPSNLRVLKDGIRITVNDQGNFGAGAPIPKESITDIYVVIDCMMSSPPQLFTARFADSG